MKLPYYDQAVIAKAKITHYLLDKSHKQGGQKANFFLRFGFSVAKWEQFAYALLQHAATHEVATTVVTGEGIHYVVEGTLYSPDGRNPLVRTVWAIDIGSTIPRLITAYPLRRI